MLNLQFKHTHSVHIVTDNYHVKGSIFKNCSEAVFLSLKSAIGLSINSPASNGQQAIATVHHRPMLPTPAVPSCKTSRARQVKKVVRASRPIKV